MTAILLIVAQIAFAAWALTTQPQSVAPRADNAARLRDGVSAADLGYEDGCLSAKSANSIAYTRFERDMYLYVHHERYSEAWDRAYRECR